MNDLTNARYDRKVFKRESCQQRLAAICGHTVEEDFYVLRWVGVFFIN